MLQYEGACSSLALTEKTLWPLSEKSCDGKEQGELEFRECRGKIIKRFLRRW